MFEYNYQLNLIAQFLLIFCSPAHTYVLLSMIFQMLMPNQMGVGDELDVIEEEDQEEMVEGLEVEGQAFQIEHIEMIVELIQNEFKLNQNQLDAIQKYLEQYYDSLFKYLLINTMNFSCCLLIFDKMLTQYSYEEIEKSIALLCSKNVDTIVAYHSIGDDLKIEINKRTQWKDFKNTYDQHFSQEGSDQTLYDFLYKDNPSERGARQSFSRNFRKSMLSRKSQVGRKSFQEKWFKQEAKIDQVLNAGEETKQQDSVIKEEPEDEKADQTKKKSFMMTETDNALAARTNEDAAKIASELNQKLKESQE